MKSQYTVEGIEVFDKYRSSKGCFVFAPTSICEGDTLGTVVFIHGYGALNPLNYGAWIRHIVDQGNVVIYPRYQRNLFRPGTKKFARNAYRGIRSGLDQVAKSELPADTSKLVYIGHSYGGALSAYMLAKEDSLVLPKGYGAILAAPGTSRFSGSRLEDYGGIKAGTYIAMVTHEDDYVTKTEFVELLDITLNANVDYVWVHQHKDSIRTPTLTAHHNECYSPDLAFDTGLRNYTTKKALRVGTTDKLDKELYWMLGDELIAAAKNNTVPDFANQSTTIFAENHEAADFLNDVIQLRGSNSIRTKANLNFEPIAPAEASGLPRRDRR